MSEMFFEIPLRLPNTEYKYGDLVAANEVYSPAMEVALVDIRLSIATLCAFADFGAGGTLTPFLGSKMEITGKTPVSVYPPAQNGDYVKVTSEYSVNWLSYFATDPTKTLVGPAVNNAWLSTPITNIRFHIDLGTARVINRIYYENLHGSGADTGNGIKTFTLWGTNDPDAFAELTYGIDTNWTQISTSRATFDQHIALDQADPKYINAANATAYRYYAIKIADSWGTAGFMGVRRIELQDSRKISGYIGAAGTGEDSFPPAFSDTYVKATTHYNSDLAPHWATNPMTSLIGGNVQTSWVSVDGCGGNQRFHIDLGATKIIDRIYYENYHGSGATTGFGVRHFTLWGSNNAAAFAELTYGIDTNWTQLACSQATFDQHVALDQADPKYIDVTNTTAYRYYAFKFSTNWDGDNYFLSVRRIELRRAVPNTTGVTVVSTPDGTTQSWESIESGFNPADPAGYTVQIYRSGYVYMCSDPSYSGATLPEFDRTPGSTTTDGGVIWTQVTPPGMRYRTPCTFDANPRYGDYRRGKKYFQPMDKADGGDLYIYDKGLAAENTRSISWEKILPADLTRLLEFIEMVRGAAYPFNFYDETGAVHQVRITNPTDIKSAPVSFNFEGGITVELLFINEPEATETGEAYYADGTCWADGIIFAG